jgi:para-aminobenzoate synthetase component 2
LGWGDIFRGNSHRSNGIREDGSVNVRILVVDNYDSFVYNIVSYLAQLAAEVTVRRNDEVGVTEAMSYDGVLLSPGPGAPAEAGVCIDMVRFCAGRRPLFGVCLGHQAIAEAFGGVVDRCPELMHGKTSMVEHDGQGVLAGLPNPFRATRYHSLAAVRDSLPPELAVSAWTSSGIVMGLRHREFAVEGVQFHPESVLTQGGHRMLANWLVTCGDPAALARSEGLAPVVAQSP